MAWIRVNGGQPPPAADRPSRARSARSCWRCKAAEAARKHVLLSIRGADSDVDSVIDQSGRPYALVCTKNQASYERRVVQRQQDLEDLAGLGQAAAGGG